MVAKGRFTPWCRLATWSEEANGIVKDSHQLGYRMGAGEEPLVLRSPEVIYHKDMHLNHSVQTKKFSRNSLYTDHQSIWKRPLLQTSSY